MGTSKSAVLAPEAMVTVWLPSLALLTKSAFGTSSTVRFTVRLALTAREAVTLNLASVPPPSNTSVFRRRMLTVSGSWMVNVARLSVPAAPPPKPVPLLEFNAPRPMSTVSPLLSTALSVAALRVRVTEVAVVPVVGPVKVTVGVSAVFRLLQVTPVGRVVGQVTM